MYKSIKLVFLLLIILYVKAQYRKHEIINPFSYTVFEKGANSWTGNTPCAISACMKRAAGQDELGPFWANRGKRDPNYIPQTLYAEEPYWVVMIRRDDSLKDLEEPFFTSRGKKDVEDVEPYRSVNLKFRDRREFPQVVESPFFAARGKRVKSRHGKV